MERRYPVIVRRFAIRRSSGGDGQWPGGDGAIREIEFLSPVEVSLLTQRRTTRPFGLAGGAPGQPGLNLLRRAGQSAQQALGPLAQFSAAPGDVLSIHTPGGGGYGSPLTR
jgi:5-oxoprolinase (ATP-hydrolysing)